MRKRHSTGGVKKQRGRWIGMWWVDGRRKSRVLGFVKEMTKSQAREAVDRIVAEENAKRNSNRVWRFGEFVERGLLSLLQPEVEGLDAGKQREQGFGSSGRHVQGPGAFGLPARRASGFARSEGEAGLSFSVVDHLRWDMKQIFDMAVAEGHIERNPALLLFTPKEARKPVRRVMTIKEVQICFGALDQRERLIAKLAVLAGMRPGEIFALTWGRLTATYADIRQRVYRGAIDTPKTDQSIRKAALSEGLLAEIENWRDDGGGNRAMMPGCFLRSG